MFLNTAVRQDTPITTTDVSWTSPAGLLSDGGSPITGYLVEWWEEGQVDEVQVVRWTSSNTALTDKFSIKFGPQPGVVETTASLERNTDAVNIRSELLNLGSATATYLIDELEVSRTVVDGSGWIWSITFSSINSDNNQGAQVPLQATIDFANPLVTVESFVAVPGSRPGGLDESQLLTITCTGSTDLADIGGWFKLSFNGVGVVTDYLPAGALGATVKRALEQLDTLRNVEVTLATETTSTTASYIYTIVFEGDVGDQSAIVVDSSLMYALNGGFTLSCRR